MSELKIVKVAVENTAYSFDALFDYLVPDTLSDKITVGARVLVPFGRANIKKIAVVFEITDKAEALNLKKVSAVLDNEPVLGKEQLELAKWMSQNTFCTLYDAAKVQLPSGMHLKLSECYEVKRPVDDVKLNDLTDDEMALYRAISASQKLVAEKKLLESFGYVDNRVLSSLVDKCLVLKTDKATANIGDKTVKTVRLRQDAPDVKLTPKQKSIIELLEDVGEATVKDICYFTGVTAAVVSTLEKKGVVELFDEEVMRVDVPNNTCCENAENIVLSQTQNDAFEQINELLKSDEPNAALLYGVTGSGKTQVFLKLIDSAVKMGKTAIVMVPEISLTPQTVKLFYKYFGTSVAVLHSALSIGERYDQFKRIKNGEVSVVVGTRSAVFAPLSNIGIIVMDEEQEATYKSESTPRYHAREVAKFRCAKNNSLLLLASATPSIDSFYYAKSGRYKLFELNERYGKAVLPEVTIVDMSDNELAQRDSAFSPTLVEEIQRNLDSSQQTILLYNRRGYHTVASCGDCKQIVTCPNCSISLTYHKKNNRLMCHYCGYSTELMTSCPSCSSKRLFYRGQGTQRIEDELSLLFPDAKILRMDMDNTSGKGEHQKQFDSFLNGEYDILVGTQMVAKGLNFPNVTLVGVLNADQTLYSNDFRAFERGFSLITQVVGRSGRGDAKGRAIIQTATPQNPVISLASQQDFNEFYNQEITVRKAMLYPPFCDICVVGFVSNNHDDAKRGANDFVEMLKAQNPEQKDIPLRVLGPSPMGVVKVFGKYRYKLIIKCKNNKQFRSMMSELLKQFAKDSKNKNITAYADLNNVGNM